MPGTASPSSRGTFFSRPCDLDHCANAGIGVFAFLKAMQRARAIYQGRSDIISLWKSYVDGLVNTGSDDFGADGDRHRPDAGAGR